MTTNHFLSGFNKRAVEYGFIKQAASAADIQEMLTGKMLDTNTLNSMQNSLSTLNGTEALALGGAGALTGAALAPKGKRHIGALLGAGLGGYAGQRDDIGINPGDVEAVRRVLHHAGR